MRWGNRSLVPAIAALVALAPTARGQAAGGSAQLEAGQALIPAVQAWIRLPVAPGHERFATDRIQAAQPGWTRDALGDLVMTSGNGSPVRIVACGLDAPAYVVSEIRDDGYLRVQMDGNGPRRQLWDQFNEGQRILIMTADRAAPGEVQMVPGVFGVRSTHLWRGRTPHDGPTTIDDLWLDVGARSRADVARMGIQLLDPVFRDLVPWRVGDYAVGPEAASRAGCAAVAAAARSTPAVGTTVFVISAQSAFSYAGLIGVIARTPAVDSVWIVGAEPTWTPDSSEAFSTGPMRLALPAAVHLGSIRGLSLRSRDPNTLIEAVGAAQLPDLFAMTAKVAGVRAPNVPVIPKATLPLGPERRDSLSPYADLLARLTDRYAVSGHEQPVRELIQSELPTWARPLAVTDTAGNLYVAAGPERDTVVIVAHMDEVGFDVEGIEPDGRVALRARGGFIGTLFSGQPALLHRDGDAQGSSSNRDCLATSASAVRGVFEIPDEPGAAAAGRGGRGRAGRGGAPAAYAWFGPDPAALGVKSGMTVTGYKCAARLGQERFTARSIDDRAGDVSLLFAMHSIDPKKLNHKVIFAFSTREEIGLEGAAALAAEFGVSVQRVLAVDTFVSSDSPIETSRFADTPIGDGAVARMLDNSSVTPPAEFARLTRIAQTNHIPLQYGTTNGGNDGSEFVRFGVPDVPIGWPLRYSHSPAELIDLRDVRSLARLVAAMAMASPR